MTFYYKKFILLVSLKVQFIGFRSYLINRIFLFNFGNKSFYAYVYVSSGVPQGSSLGPLLFLIYFNDMPQAVKYNIFLYTDDTCLVSRQKDINEIVK